MPMVTLWLPLTPCGIDAPSLELYPVPQSHLWHYRTLNDASLAAHFAPTQPELVQLEPGDGVLVHWGTLHRSGIRAGMRRDRFSLGLRWFNPMQIPAMLRSDRWLSMEKVALEGLP
jgi:ectoine hydroxylase-related dioxygenase (phytanoyl-CoA dioxygenase family)